MAKQVRGEHLIDRKQAAPLPIGYNLHQSRISGFVQSVNETWYEALPPVNFIILPDSLAKRFIVPGLGATLPYIVAGSAVLP